MTHMTSERDRTGSLNIKNPEAYRLIRQLADETGESMTQAVTVAVRERLHRLHDAADTGGAERRHELQSLADRLASRFQEPYRSLDHGDWLYDDDGLPR